MRLHRFARSLAVLLSGATLASGAVRAHEDRDDTLARLEAAIAERPDDPMLWCDRAVLERRRGHFARAHADLTHAVALGLDPVIAQRDRGLIWLDEQRFGEAEATLRVAREMAPDEPPILLAHARALAGLERWREASDTFARLVEIAPTSSPDVQLERIAAVEAAGGIESALAATDAALATLGPIPALEEKGLDLELRAGRTDAALARLDRMNSGPARRDALLLRRAEILERSGRSQAARAAYADALAALASRPASRRSTPAAQQLEAQAREAIARLAQGDAP